MLSRLLFLLPLLLPLLPIAPAWAQLPKLDVNVKRVDVDGLHQFEVSATGTVQAVPAVVWKILTNYERQPEFVPDLLSAKVLSRNGNRVVLEQEGQARFLFFRRDIRLVVNILEEPMSRIGIDLVEGDMKVYDCRWELQPLPDNAGTRIVYSGKLVPKFYVPGLLGANLMRSDIERMMSAVLARIDQPG
ncbi:MAG: SRPBCC family protein [Gammaproteobacteria bacterium]